MIFAGNNNLQVKQHTNLCQRLCIGNSASWTQAQPSGNISMPWVFVASNKRWCFEDVGENILESPTFFNAQVSNPPKHGLIRGSSSQPRRMVFLWTVDIAFAVTSQRLNLKARLRGKELPPTGTIVIMPATYHIFASAFSISFGQLHGQSPMFSCTHWH